MEQRLFRMVRERAHDLVAAADDRIEAGEIGSLLLEAARDRVGLCRIPVDPDARRGVEIIPKRRGVHGLIAEEILELGLDLAFCPRRISAGRRHAVAAGRCRLRYGAGEMVILVGRDHEQRVVLGDAVHPQPVEELAEGRIVGLKLDDVSGLPGPKVPSGLGGAPA